MLGVHGKADVIKLEKFARNQVGLKPDIEGKVLRRRRIDPKKRAILTGTLFAGFPNEGRGWVASRSAGNYLCNYLYFQMCAKRPNWECGFIHVPTFEKISCHKQIKIVESIIKLIEN